MKATEQKKARNNTLLLLGVWFGVFYFITESLIDLFVFHEGNLARLISSTTLYEIWMRLIVVIILVIFGAFAQLIANNYERITRALRESETKYSAVAEQIKDGVIIIQDEVFEFANKSMAHIIGYPVEKIIGMDFLQIVILDHRIQAKEAYQSVIQKKKEYQYLQLKIRHKNGMLKDVQILEHFLIYKDRPAVLAIVSDLTEHKEPKDELAENELCLSLALDAARAGLWELYLQTNAISLDSRLYEMLGYKEGDLPLALDKTFFHPEDWETIQNKLENIKEGRTANFLSEHRMLTKAGEWKWIHAWATVFNWDREGKPLRIIGAAGDIDERKKLEAALLESEQRYLNLQADIPIGIFRSTSQGSLISANPAFVKMLGCRSEEEALKIPAIVFYTEPHRREELIEELKAKGAVKGFQIQIRRKDNTKIWAKACAKAIKDENGALVYLEGFAEDITSLKTAEEQVEKTSNKLKEAREQLIQASKMSSMGQLAADISYELSQSLMGIKGSTKSVLLNLDEKSPFLTNLKDISENADKIDKIIKNFRLFAKKSEFKMGELDINDAIEESLALLNQQLQSHNIRVNKHLAKHLPRIQGDANSLQQVFLHLIADARNSIDRIESLKGGELTIRTILSRDKKNIEITFGDTGCGAPKNNPEYIFSPFHAANSNAAGITPGLSVVSRIIENHKGRIMSESRIDEGTTVKIFLPVA